MTDRTQADEIAWLRSSLVCLLSLAEAGSPNLTHKEVAAICKVTLDRFAAPRNTAEELKGTQDE